MNVDDPEVDAATLQQMAYNSNFTEDINIRMRVPETITVESSDQEEHYKRNPPNFYHPSIESKLEARGNGSAALKMEVPDRIVVSVGKDGIQYDHGDMRAHSPVFGVHQSTNPVSLKTPPRVLTLQDHHLDSLNPYTHTNDEEHNTDEHSFQGPTASALTDSSEDLDDVTLMRKQVYKLHKRLALLEEEQTTRARREYIVYGVTAVLWLLNGWFLYSHRRLY